MGLREVSKPPTSEEMVIVHQLLKKAVQLRETEGSAALTNFRYQLVGARRRGSLLSKNLEIIKILLVLFEIKLHMFRVRHSLAFPRHLTPLRYLVISLPCVTSLPCVRLMRDSEMKSSMVRRPCMPHPYISPHDTSHHTPPTHRPQILK